MRQLILLFCLFSLAGCSPAGMQAFSEFADGFSQAMADNPTPTFSAPSTYTPSNYQASSSSGNSFYSSSECIGAVVNGRCAGTINPDPSNVMRKKCYGTIINGECQGTIGY